MQSKGNGRDPGLFRVDREDSVLLERRSIRPRAGDALDDPQRAVFGGVKPGVLAGFPGLPAAGRERGTAGDLAPGQLDVLECCGDVPPRKEPVADQGEMLVFRYKRWAAPWGSTQRSRFVM